MEEVKGLKHENFTLNRILSAAERGEDNDNGCGSLPSFLSLQKIYLKICLITVICLEIYVNVNLWGKQRQLFAISCYRLIFIIF